MGRIEHCRAWLPRPSVVLQLLEVHATELAGARGRSNAGSHWNPGLIVNNEK